MTVFVDPDVPAPTLRQTIYHGDLVVLTKLRSVREFVDYTREQLVDLFNPYEPEHAHEHIDKAEMARLLGSWKPSFIHSPRSKDLICEIIREAGFRAEATHYDVPKPRTSFPVGHLTTGIAYAFPWHRDVWYGAPAQQINWWLPVFAVRGDNAMSFDLHSFDRYVRNSSATFDYYKNNAARLHTAAQMTREKPGAPGGIGLSAARRPCRTTVPRRSPALLRGSASCLDSEYVRTFALQCRFPYGRRPRSEVGTWRPPG